MKQNETFIECFECGGDGTYYSTYPNCSKPATECCGGCYDLLECDYCEGTGEIHPINDEMQDEIMMLNSYEKMLKSLKELKHELKMIENESSEDAIATMELCFSSNYQNDLKSLDDQINRIDIHRGILENSISNEIDRYNGR